MDREIYKRRNHELFSSAYLTKPFPSLFYRTTCFTRTVRDLAGSLFYPDLVARGLYCPWMLYIDALRRKESGTVAILRDFFFFFFLRISDDSTLKGIKDVRDFEGIFVSRLFLH